MHATSNTLRGIPDGNIINLANLAIPSTYSQLKISDLIQEKVNAGEYFYGIEIAPGFRQTLNYNLFKIAPLFTSIVWIATNNWSNALVQEGPALVLAKKVEQNGPVLSHLSCHMLTRERLISYLNPSVSNVMAVRGDIVEPGQQFQYGLDLVKEIRAIRKDDICISVGGYPEGHPESTSHDEDLQHLKEKVDAGADLIITQLSFSEEALLKFIKDCRQKGITIPILPGIYIPKNWSNLKFILNLTKVKMPKDLLFEYESRKDNETLFRSFAEQQAVKTIRALFNSGLRIYGVQFFTMNNFKNIENVVRELFPNPLT